MNLIHIYCGDFKWCPINIEILGDLKFTDSQMSTIGKELKPYQWGNEIRRVFTNNENIIHGIQIAVKRRDLSNEQVTFKFMVDDQEHNVMLDADGNFMTQPQGFFEQTRTDLLELF